MQAGDGEAPVVIQTECVDVYLLRPEEPREIELKDFTIMKPKNNKMHRLVRYYPRCEISYRATAPPPPEEKEVTSPGGTTTITMVVPERAPRHNGGFSNPSRNAEVFRLKRKLLQEYVASVNNDDREAALFDALITGSRSSSRPVASSSSYTMDSESHGQFSQAPSCPPSPPVRRPLPKYKPVAVGDEDYILLTNEREARMTLDERVKYVSSLWPSLAPTDEDDEIMDYYGLEVQIISEEEREKELLADKTSDKTGPTGNTSSSSKQKGSSTAALTAAKVSSQVDAKPDDPQASNSKPTDEDKPSTAELPINTRSSALLKLQEAEDEDEDDIMMAPIATKQDDWVQCDKCQKWRRLPNHVNVSELPAIWYCKMNQWDKRHNKCSSPEEKPVVMVKGEDLGHYLQRKFAQDYMHRIKRLEKGMHRYKYANLHDDDGARKFVQCAECLKLRPLLGGMDPNKVPEPFVCWMNWDEVLSSCSAPERLLPPRVKAEPRTSSPHHITDDVKSKKGSTVNTGSASSGGQPSKAASSGSQHVSRGGGPGKGSSKGSKKVKRKTAAGKASAGSNGGNSQKKVKRK